MYICACIYIYHHYYYNSSRMFFIIIHLLSAILFDSVIGPYIYIIYMHVCMYIRTYTQYTRGISASVSSGAGEYRVASDRVASTRRQLYLTRPGRCSFSILSHSFLRPFVLAKCVGYVIMRYSLCCRPMDYPNLYSRACPYRSTDDHQRTGHPGNYSIDVRNERIN